MIARRLKSSLRTQPAATSETSPRVVPLNQLRPGQSGQVSTAELCDDDCQLLRAMGIRDQCRLRVCRGGRSCIVKVASTRLCLSDEMSQNIMVAVDATDA